MSGEVHSRCSRVLDYEQEVHRVWTTSDKFVEACDILKARVKWCKNLDGSGRGLCVLLEDEKGSKKEFLVKLGCFG